MRPTLVWIFSSFLLATGFCDDLNHTEIITSHRYRRQSGNGCNYNYQFNELGQTAMLNSPGYPGSYGPNIDCRYTISSPPGTRMSIECSDFNVEPSQNCFFDVFFLSPSGDTTFQDQEYFCGSGGFTRNTQGNRLAIGFHSDQDNLPSNQPFRYQCRITVIQGNQQPSCSCGQRNLQSRIVGGTNANRGEFPWRCALYSRFLGVFCGCTIISRNWVLSAAHCTNAVQPGDQIFVNVGDHDLSRNDDADNKVVPVDYVVQNNFYNDKTEDSDITLLRLQSPLTFTRDISPVCLPWKFANANFDGQTGTASGWGGSFFGHGVTPVLQKVDIPLISAERCSRYYDATSVTITNNMICAYAPGKDTCQGDSGTSIDYGDPSNLRYYAIGVTSLGVGCAEENKPGIYTFIPRFLNWIQGNTQGETFCRI